MTENENPPALLTGSVSTETQLTPDQARALTNRIKVSVGHVWELVEIAYTRMAWRALNYDSWDCYVAEEFGTNRIRLPREERTEVVTSLRANGLSLRAIAAVTGDSPSTVGNVLKSSEESTVQNCIVEDGAQDSERPLKLIVGRDGKKRRTNNRFDRIKAEQKRMKAEAEKRKAAKDQQPRRFPVTGIISDLKAVAVHIGALDQEKMTPTQRRDIAAAITRLAEAIGMHYEGITFDDGGFSMATPPPEGP